MMTSETSALIEKELAKRGVDLTRACTECGKSQWQMEARLGALPTLRGASSARATDPGNVHPLFVVTCRVCSAARFFNVAHLGIDIDAGA